ncbi:extracellular solute-binding protein [Paralcaligenes sp. KSB-10]|uniref:extracellular solute-binding protein n=1 Tax=Paralcaligenes sp. KSB-10 TaxID=2901142 RepID=UPI001E468B5D|nr:extracellular solute-binding protein [Paralcaligenes sp. KSB-10]UHL64401.1 extracellular solute-binding protein [Paralcaligenes sp. KSB-10]
MRAISRASSGILGAVLLAGLTLTVPTVNAKNKPDKIVATAYGGIWADSVKKNFVSCFEKKTGVKVDVLTGESAAWLNKIRANPSKPPIDVITLAEADSFRAGREGLLDKITQAKVPYLKDIPDSFHKPWNDYSVVLNFGAMGVMYNKEAIKNPPASWKDLIEGIIAGKYGKKIAWPSGTYTWGPEFIWFVAQQYGGSIDTAFQKIKAMQPYIVKFWNTPVEALNLFGTKTADIVLYWDGRAHSFIDKGNPWAGFYIPQPNTIAGSVLISKVKNSPDIAWDYLNCALSPKGQLGHAETILYGITNKTVVYPPDIKNKVTSADRVIIPPYSEIIDKIPGWVERWNKEIQ